MPLPKSANKTTVARPAQPIPRTGASAELIFEEWGWEPLQRLVGHPSRLPLWARMEVMVSRLPPQTVVLGAKMLGTVDVARLSALARPALMQLHWFARLCHRWNPWKDGLIAKMKASSSWSAMRASVQALKGSLRALRDALLRP